MNRIKYYYLLIIFLSTLILTISCDLSNDSPNTTPKEDKTDPIIVILGYNPDTVAINSGNYQKPEAYAFDTINDANVIDTVDLTQDIKVSGSVDTEEKGTYQLIYSVSDFSGNEAVETLSVVVVEEEDVPEPDSIKPIIYINGSNPDTINVGENWNEPTISATDNKDGDITDRIKKTGTVNSDKAGKYEIVYTVSDFAANSTEKVLTVYVIDVSDEDTVVPTITIAGSNPDTITIGSSWIKPEVSAYDNKDGDISDNINESGSVNKDKVGRYEIVFSVSDAAGNSTSKTLIVYVVEIINDDNVAPTITISGPNPDTITVGDSWSEPTVKAEDNIDGDISDEIIKTGKVDTSKVGTYEIVYSVSDKAGNSTTKTLKIVVIKALDTKAPVITITGDNPIIINTGETFVAPDVKAMDETDGDISSDIQKSGNVNSSEEGTYKIIYTVVDAAGNSASDTLTVIVVFAYPVHSNIKASTFWCGEGASSDNDFITNTMSAWNNKWGEHFGLEDHPTNISRDSDFIPTSSKYTGNENPYYCALPYNDYGDLVYDGSGPTIDGYEIDNYWRKFDCYDNIHWGNDKSPAGWGNNYSLCKNRWIKVKVHGSDKVCYAQWEDAGPYYYNDYPYVFGSSDPANTTDKPYAGIDLSPSVGLYLGQKMNDWGAGDFYVDWEFVDEDAVPDGPWKRHVTTSQVNW